MATVEIAAAVVEVMMDVVEMVMDAVEIMMDAVEIMMDVVTTVVADVVMTMAATGVVVIAAIVEIVVIVEANNVTYRLRRTPTIFFSLLCTSKFLLLKNNFKSFFTPTIENNSRVKYNETN